MASFSKKEKVKYLKELNFKDEDVRRFIKKRKKKREDLEEVIEKGYTTYEMNYLGKVANYFTRDIAYSLVKKNPNLVKNLFQNLRLSGIRMFSRTYNSILLFLTAFGFVLGTLLGVVIFLNYGVIGAVIRGLIFGIFVMVLTGFLTYHYPSMLIGSRARKIKNELPFVILTMSAVAGSGANPISIFKLILETGEYKEVSGEIKKIMNYVNLFGYDLTTALSAVAKTTPSEHFKELLNGMVATIESGGDLKDYLRNKAMDAMNNYRLERKKYVQSLDIYSDIYTGLLIAAPLLFLVTLAIINVLGGTLFGLKISVIAGIGTYLILPLLNIGFLVFVNLMQPEV